MSKTKPILFNTEMVKAILAGAKNCTRRIVKFLPGQDPQQTEYIQDGLILYNGQVLYNGENVSCIRKSPYCAGDILYVRETWCWCPCWDCGMNAVEGCCDKEAVKLYNIDKKEFGCYGYKASFEENEAPFERWHPSIHMPKAAARIWLKVTSVSLERLQDITDDGAKAEGANCKDGKNVGWQEKQRRTAIERFSEIWESTVSKEKIDSCSWAANPWVWVIEFERCEKWRGNAI